MRMKTKVRGAVGGLFGLTALVAALIAFVIFVVVALATLAVVASAIIAYVKRDAWTVPAYKWARDKSGRWNLTPWSAGDATSEPAPLE
jgi:uncharacterized membrane protein